ncbi:MAG: glycosyltransferase [Cyanobacteria bacterium J06598_4]
MLRSEQDPFSGLETAARFSRSRHCGNQKYPIFSKMLISKSSETTKQAIGLSVIIPTSGRAVLCRELLMSLSQSQEYCSVPTEIWVVDDSPNPQDSASIKASCHDVKAQYCQFTGSVAQKRNWGAKQAQYPILLFIDSDCIATPCLLQAHWISYQKKPNQSAAIGSTEFCGTENWLWQVVKLTPYLNSFSLAQFQMPVLWGPSNNLSCRQADFEQLSGFDERSPKPLGSEDVDFGYRLYYRGKTMMTCPEAKLYHSTETWKTLSAVLLRLIRWGRGEAYIIERYWSELYDDCPDRYGCALALILVGTLSALLLGQFFWLYLPLIFLVVNFASRLLWRIFNQPKYALRILQLIAAEALILFYETAILFHLLSRDFDLKPFFSCVIIRPEDALAIWNIRIFEVWKRILEITLSGLAIYGWLHRI